VTDGRGRDGVVTGVVPGRAMTDAERAARYRARKRVAREAEGVARREVVGMPFLPGHDASLKHGAYSARSVSELAAGIERDLVAHPATRADTRSPVWRFTLTSWCQAQAEVALLRSYRDRITIEAAVAETTTLDEVETRTRGGKSVRHVSSQRVEPILTAIDRVERRLLQLGKALGFDQLGRGAAGAFDQAAYVAALVAAARNGMPEPPVPDLQVIGLASYWAAEAQAKEILAGPAELPPAG
jgi:hypothetical protein